MSRHPEGPGELKGPERPAPKFHPEEPGPTRFQNIERRLTAFGAVFMLVGSVYQFLQFSNAENPDAPGARQNFHDGIVLAILALVLGLMSKVCAKMPLREMRELERKEGKRPFFEPP